MYSAAKRNVEVRQILAGIGLPPPGGRAPLASAVTELVSGTANRVQQRPLETLVYFGAKAADMNVNDIRLRIEMVVPDSLEQHRAGDYLAAMTHQVFQQPKLCRFDLQQPATAPDLTLQKIDFEVGNSQRGGIGRFRVGPPYQRFEPRHQLAESERFDEVVVAAGLQPGDPVIDFAERAQDQRRSAIVGGCLLYTS
mgnify:CR=1 FL=1